MTIEALSEQTVRLLGSSQLVSSPRAVVKELVDNALDASATSIAVDITANTLDAIQVRDNGHGVPSDDRSLLCKQHCTSKLRDLSDLKTIAPRSLGFRGEALAGIAEVAGSLHIATRVQGEKVACVIKFQNGRTSRESSSLAIGTTVKILDLFKRVPVRRQTIAKAASRSLVKIKELIQAYALTHPTVRFFLRISKSRSPRPDWIYTPGSADDICLAAIKVVGKDCAHQCERHSLEHRGYLFDALLFRPDADAEKINGFGPFISIDLRPMSASKGPLQQIYKTYKGKIKDVSRYETRDPFIYLNLSCPPMTYDINMEPSKDDVIFEASAVVLEAASQLLDSIYGIQNNAIQAEENIDNAGNASSEIANESSLVGRMTTRSSPQYSPIPVNANASNPWIYAKMHSPNKSKKPLDIQQSGACGLSNHVNYGSGASPAKQPGDLPTPDLSSSPRRISNQEGAGGSFVISDEDMVYQDMGRHGESMQRRGLTRPPIQSNAGSGDEHFATGQPLLRDNSEAAPAEVVQCNRPRRQRGLSAPFRVPRKVTAQNAPREPAATSRTAAKRLMPITVNQKRHAKAPRLDFEAATSAQIKVSGHSEEKASENGHEGYVQNWLQHQLVPNDTATRSDHPNQQEGVDQSRGNEIRTELVRDADIADLFLRNSPPRQGRSAPGAVQVGQANATRDVGQHVDRLVAALSTSTQAIQECCTVLRSVALADAAYPDIPAEETPREGDFGHEELASCGTTPETLRPTSLSSVSGEEIEEWRAQLLDFLAHEGESAPKQAVQTPVY